MYASRMRHVFSGNEGVGFLTTDTNTHFKLQGLITQTSTVPVLCVERV